MKTILQKIKLQMVYFIMLSGFYYPAHADVVQIIVANTVFTPPSVNVNVGDVIVWKWVSGSHTTTSTLVPAGAATWNEPMNSTDTSFSYVVTVPGTYNYQCTPHSATMTGSFTAFGTTSVNAGFSSGNFLTVFPNPVSGKFRITAAQYTAENISMDIFDITGKKINSLANNQSSSGIFSEEFDIAGKLEKGIYFISIQEGEKKHIQKIIVN